MQHSFEFDEVEAPNVETALAPAPPVTICRICEKPAKVKKGVCHVCFMLKRRFSDLDTLAKYSLDLLEEEKDRLKKAYNSHEAECKENGRQPRLPYSMWEEIVIRAGAGQYRSEIVKSLKRPGGDGRHRSYSWEVARVLNVAVAKKAINRLRLAFNEKASRSVIPITNPFTLAVRLETLYLQSAAAGNIKDALAVLKTSREILSDEVAGKVPTQQNNFLTIIQRIHKSNMAERSVRINSLKDPGGNRIEDAIVRDEQESVA